jgi:hypothetical protein
LAIMKSRFPSRQELVWGFAACVFPIFSWSVLIFFKRMQYWGLFLSTWDLIGTFAYSQVFALIESTTLLLILVILSSILPQWLLRERFVAHTIMIVLIGTVWIILEHLEVIHFFDSLLWPSLCLVSFGLSHALVLRSERLQGFMNRFADRLTVLLHVYIPTALLSAVVIVYRSISGGV